jgi:hypothetical protein
MYADRFVKDFTSMAIENVQRGVALSSNTANAVELGALGWVVGPVTSE